MDSEIKLWMAVIIAAVLIFFGSISFWVKTAGAYYSKAQSECVARGGSWIPISDYKALCLQGIKP